MRRTVLVVDDERDLRDLLQHHLVGAGFDVLTAATGNEALKLVGEGPPDLILLDIMLPDIQGTEILRVLRQTHSTRSIPVICLTARGEEVDRVVGFELGADDYVVKPFSPRELVLRVQAALRRSASDTAESGTRLAAGELTMDLDRHEVLLSGSPVDLTPTEFKLLAFLMQNPGKVLARQRMLDQVWGETVYVSDRTVDTHVRRLRSKLGDVAEHIETIRGVGYRFRS